MPFLPLWRRFVVLCVFITVSLTDTTTCVPCVWKSLGGEETTLETLEFQKVFVRLELKTNSQPNVELTKTSWKDFPSFFTTHRNFHLKPLSNQNIFTILYDTQPVRIAPQVLAHTRKYCPQAEGTTRI